MATQIQPGWTPPFYFQANRLRQSDRFRSIVDLYGRWLPPRALEANVIRQGQSTDKIFRFDGTMTREIATLPSEAIHFRTVSMYYSGGYFFHVPFDASLYSVGSGCATINVDPDEDSGDDDDDGDADGPEFNSIDWNLVRFNWDSNAFTSEIWADGVHNQLNTQREDQTWVRKVIPQNYRAEYGRRTADPSLGGLSGDLSMLIGLVAFSVYDGAVKHAFEHCVKPVHTYGWRAPDRNEEEGWIDKRGFVIHIWSCPPYSTNDHLHAMEQGMYGKIFH